jgi:UDP-glucose 4-epimerase
MRILITGGLGYLGGRLDQYLAIDKSNTIILASRNPINTIDWLPQTRIVNILWSSNTELEMICSGVDVVIHLAGMNAKDCSKDPSSALQVNGLATSRLLQSAIKQNVKRFVYLSSSHVYDSPLTGKITEKSAVKNLHPYASSHKAGEDAVMFAHFLGEIEGVVIRLSNSFGAPADINANCWSLVTNDLCKQAIQHSKMTIKDTKMQRRDFISLTNVCRAINHLIKLPKSQLDNGLFNIGGEWTPRIIDVATILSKRIYKLLGKKIDIEARSLNKDLITPSLDYDISKVKSTNFKLINNRNDEFDDLIQFCNDSFGA